MGKAIFVGDRSQSIYGFTGADNDAIDLLINEFNADSLPLTVTYRCPKSVVAEARKYVDHIEAHASAPEGVVRTIEDGKLFSEKFCATDAILCRLTAPIVKIAFRLIRNGIACHVEGRDIGVGLTVLLKKWKRVKSVEDLIEKLESFRDHEVAKLKAKHRETAAEALSDKVETLIVLSEGCETLECIEKKIATIFQDSDGLKKPTLTLSTVHKAKGREWPRVFLYGHDTYMPSKWARQEWQQEQERNIIYVALTRAQKELVLADGPVKKSAE